MPTYKIWKSREAEGTFSLTGMVADKAPRHEVVLSCVVT